MTTAWTPDHVSAIRPGQAGCVPLVTSADRSDLEPGWIYWDMWPVQDRTGRPADLAGRELWMALAAPQRRDPSLRHFEAVIRVLERCGDRWADRGLALPRQVVPYEREWAGSAVSDGRAITLYFTAAGTAARAGGYQQQLFEAHGRIGSDGLPHSWMPPVASIADAAPHYMAADAHEGEAGKIKAFRDPAYFCDPADGREYLIFTASLAGSASAYNGAVGIAVRSANGWQLLPPLVHADGVNNELERAHVVHHAGRYYVLWATQNGTFAPHLRHAPGGLYGMVADSLTGPYRPLNGTGLVLINPASEPMQTYSWFVTGDLQVSSFIDFWGLSGKQLPADPAAASEYFGGVPAPLLQLAIHEDRCTIVDTVAA